MISIKIIDWTMSFHLCHKRKMAFKAPFEPNDLKHLYREVIDFVQNAAVENLAAKGNIYLGISQQLEEGGPILRHWHNIYTGESISYSNWMNRQPNNFNGNEHYALMLR